MILTVCLFGQIGAMHSMGLHSALAIKRQRKRRDEQRRAKERRFSQQSNESGLGESQSSFMSPRASIRERARRGHRGEPSESIDSKVNNDFCPKYYNYFFLKKRDPRKIS